MKLLGWIVAVFALAAALTGIVAAGEGSTRDFTLTTGDGVHVAATYRDSGAAASGGLVLLHMMNHTRADWRDFSALAAKENFCSVAIDLRGHGESTQGPGGKKLDWHQFKDVEFQGMIRDVEAAYGYLIKEKNVDPGRIGIVGASIGANLAVKFAAAHPGAVRAVVLLSPGRDYRSVKIDADVNRFAGKMFFYASRGDRYSFDSCAALAAAAKDRAVGRTLDQGEAHGTDILTARPAAGAEIVAWLKQNIQGVNASQ